MRIAAMVLLVAALPALIACSSATPRPGSQPTLRQQMQAQVVAQAVLRAHLRAYEQRLQLVRVRQWQAIQSRARAQLAARNARRQVRLDAARRRWGSFQ